MRSADLGKLLFGIQVLTIQYNEKKNCKIFKGFFLCADVSEFPNKEELIYLYPTVYSVYTTQSYLNRILL